MRWTLHLTIERWKRDGDYLVSNMGRIKKNGKEVQQLVSKDGYMCVNYNGKLISAHRLIAKVWLGDVDGMTIDHLDHNKRNNCVKNLEIVSKDENILRAKIDRIDEYVEENAMIEYIIFDNKKQNIWDVVEEVRGNKARAGIYEKIKNCCLNGNKTWKGHQIGGMA